MKALLFLLCGFCAAVILFFTADMFGVGGPPWYGWWDSITASAGQPFVLKTAGVARGGASDVAGIRAGDIVDLREQTLDGRFARVFQLDGTRTADLVVRRGDHRMTVHVRGSATMDGPHATKVPAKVLPIVAALWFLVCGLLIVLRRGSASDARTIAAILLLHIPALLRPGTSWIPSVPWMIAAGLLAAASEALSAFLLIRFMTRNAIPSALGRGVATVGYIAILAAFSRTALGLFGLATLAFDPIPYLAARVTAQGAYAIAWDLVPSVQWFITMVLAILATQWAPRSERARAMWLFLPLPIAFFVEAIVFAILGLASSWVVYMILVTSYNICWLLGGFAVTYAIFKRRVLDLGFVISRTLVVTIVSLIVLVSFILLEWAIGTVLVDTSHATGIAAGGALALVLGLSMRFIHERVDHAVDLLFFRKRHEDESALRDFAKEAAFITDETALLDRVIWNVSNHTDASSAALFTTDGRGYVAVRASGNSPTTFIEENDGVVLALKTWHKPLDPHRYETTIRGALAVPMLARGALLGVLVLDERAGAEAYAPDEIDALAQFAHGVASALDNLQSRNTIAFNETLTTGLATLSRKIDDLSAKLSTET